MPNYRVIASGKQAEMFFYDQFGSGWMGDGITAKQVAADLKAMGKVDKLTIRMNSEGGDVFEATAIYNQLIRFPARKEIDIDGMALSAASFVMMAADEIRMADNAMVMIHNPQTLVAGDEHDLRARASLLVQAKENIVRTYAKRLKTDDAEISALMDAESWMDADMALKAGFIDKISAPMNVTACFTQGRFRNCPPEFARRAQSTARPGSDINRVRIKQMGERIKVSA